MHTFLNLIAGYVGQQQQDKASALQAQKQMEYGDVSNVDFQDMQNTLATAKTLFEELPEQVKATFNNEMHTFP